VLFNEPKLLKSNRFLRVIEIVVSFSALQRAEIAEILMTLSGLQMHYKVSVLFNEPKLLKFTIAWRLRFARLGFSALQRAEIAEIQRKYRIKHCTFGCFSALQRAEIAEISHTISPNVSSSSFQCSSTSRNC